MAIKYEYYSTCCNHYYIEARNNHEAQINTKCNICRVGDYVETSRNEFESISVPVSQVMVERSLEE